MSYYYVRVLLPLQGGVQTAFPLTHIPYLIECDRHGVKIRSETNLFLLSADLSARTVIVMISFFYSSIDTLSSSLSHFYAQINSILW